MDTVPVVPNHPSLQSVRTRLRQQQEPLEELKKQMHGCGIEVHEDGSTATARSEQLGG
jgi:hypothetical protein